MTDLRDGPTDRRSASESRAAIPPGVQLSKAQRIAAIGGIATIVLLLGVLVFDGIARAHETRDAVRDSHHMLEAAQATLQDLTNAETGQRGYLITRDETYLAPYRQALASLTADTLALRRFAGADSVHGRQLDTLSKRIDAKLAELARTIALARAGGPTAAKAEVKTGHGKLAMEDIRGVLGAISARQAALLARRLADSDRHYRNVMITDIAGTAVVVLLALVLNSLLTRYADQQAASARLLHAQNSELNDANRRLGEQTMELELQNQQLQEQTVELETQQTQLEEQASELEVQAEELASSVEKLQEQTVAAEDAMKRAEDANQAKSLFLTTMSHELRTPLNAIAGYVDLLVMEIRGPLVRAQHDDLMRIKKSGQHLLSLINDILNLAKIESGHLDLHITDVPLATILENVDTLVAPQFGAKGIRYEYPRCDASLRVCADSEKVQQILLNLLSNACKFTDAGGRVSVECEVQPGEMPDAAQRVALRVSDSGRGIASDKLEKIFEPFVQVDRHLTGASQQGVGLGLAISRDLARSMSGDLAVESEPGVGTTFVLTLPRGSSGVVVQGAGTAPRENAGPLATQ
jgi:signal transduction histidine kinase